MSDLGLSVFNHCDDLSDLELSVFNHCDDLFDLELSEMTCLTHWLQVRAGRFVLLSSLLHTLHYWPCMSYIGRMWALYMIELIGQPNTQFDL